MPLITPQMLSDARDELNSKDDKDIERDTALKWAARYLVARGMPHKLATPYLHEALEHAAMVGAQFLTELVKETGEAVSHEDLIAVRDEEGDHLGSSVTKALATEVICFYPRR